MGTIDPETGTTVYYLTLGNGYSKIYAKPFDSFWCCNGTGAEEFAKLTDTIYFHDGDSVFVNLFIASEVSWPEKGLRLTQQTSFPDEQGTRLLITAANPVNVDLKLRIPYWTKTGTVKVNGHVVPTFAAARQLPRSAWSLEEWRSRGIESPDAFACRSHARQTLSASSDVWSSGDGGKIQ